MVKRLTRPMPTDSLSRYRSFSLRWRKIRCAVVAYSTTHTTEKRSRFHTGAPLIAFWLVMQRPTERHQNLAGLRPKPVDYFGKTGEVTASAYDVKNVDRICTA